MVSKLDQICKISKSSVTAIADSPWRPGPTGDEVLSSAAQSPTPSCNPSLLSLPEVLDHWYCQVVAERECQTMVAQDHMAQGMAGALAARPLS